MAKIVPLFSSSKGNSYYISGNNEAVIIDAGRSCKQIENALIANDIDTRTIKAIFISHEHSDHCTALKVFSKRYALPVFATGGTLDALIRGDRLDPSVKCEQIVDEIAIGDMMIKRVNTSHDSAESCGFFITTADNRKCSIITDTGFLTDDSKKALLNSNLAVIESNHDIDMLKNGAYPYVLKKRILSMTGHLSNKDCSAFLPQMAQCGVTRFILGHLSEENNSPQIALSNAIAALEYEGLKRDIDYTIDAAPVQTMGKSVIF